MMLIATTWEMIDLLSRLIVIIYYYTTTTSGKPK
jgi:hypothetical protein